MLTAFLHWLETSFDLSNPSGLAILALLAAITDIGIPVPFILDTILMLTAYKVCISAYPHWTPVIMIVIMLFIGRQIGSGILYLLARYLGYAFLKVIKKYFPSIGHVLDSFKERLHHWAPLVVVTGRLTPGLLQVTSIASGTIRLRYYFFAAGIAIASLVYDGLLILLAFIASRMHKVSDENFTSWLVITMIVLVCVLWPVLFVIIKSRFKKHNQVIADQ
jgi:membrane protein DedA with SNARE-associated domain